MRSKRQYGNKGDDWNNARIQAAAAEAESLDRIRKLRDGTLSCHSDLATKTIIEFGSFKGQRVSQVTHGYLAWMHKQEWLNGKVREAVDQEILCRQYGKPGTTRSLTPAASSFKQADETAANPKRPANYKLRAKPTQSLFPATSATAYVSDAASAVSGLSRRIRRSGDH
jgi:uncharacterized protein (DUF3820 family)